MKTSQNDNNFRSAWRRLFRRRSRSHDRLLVLNMSLFNFTDSWSRTFSKDEYARSSS